MILSAEQLASFAEAGFLHLPGAVDAARVAAARARIDSALADDRSIGRIDYFSTHSFCPGLVRDPALLALFADGAAPRVLGTLFGAPHRVRAPEEARIALRFPDHHSEPGVGAPQIDGFPSGLNGVAPEQVDRQTAIVGVFLSPARGNMGNPAVWPGSHRRVARFMRLMDAPRFVARHGAARLHNAAMVQDLGPGPEQIAVEPGDALILHHLLAHGVARNLSLHVQHAVYFRVLHAEDDARDAAPLMDERRFFDGVDWPA